MNGLGASVSPAATAFRVWAPRCGTVEVVAEGRAPVALTAHASGVWTAALEGLGAGARYRYRLDGTRERPDPASRWQPAGVHGPSAVVDWAAFPWSDASFAGHGLEELVIYELHVGTFTRSGTFEAVIPHLPAVRDLGVTALELMPVAEFPGDRDWGYDGVHLFAPQSTYGGPEGLRRLVDGAHAAGLSVVLDVVYNHLGPEGNYLAEFAPYFTDRHPTPWGPGLDFDGPDAAGVRRHFVENARRWVREYHVDGLRLDAIHAITDASPVHILTEVAEAARAEAKALGRPVHLIAESHDNDRRIVLPAAAAGLGLDATWSDDFHHALHARLTGELAGYYADYPGGRGLARALTEGFAYQGEPSRFWRRPRGTPSADLPGKHFVICLQNHDLVGNRTGSARLGTLLPPAAIRLAVALLCAAPAIPLLFMGEEHGETAPFPFFASFLDPALREAVRAGRRREMARFGWPAEVPHPGDPATFQRARLDHALALAPGHRELRAYYRDWLALRRRHPALGPGHKALARAELDPSGDVLILTRGTPAGPGVRLLANLSAERRPAPAGPGGATLIDSEDRRYGGGGRELLAPFQALLVDC